MGRGDRRREARDSQPRRVGTVEEAKVGRILGPRRPLRAGVLRPDALSHAVVRRLAALFKRPLDVFDASWDTMTAADARLYHRALDILDEHLMPFEGPGPRDREEWRYFQRWWDVYTRAILRIARAGLKDSLLVGPWIASRRGLGSVASCGARRSGSSAVCDPCRSSRCAMRPSPRCRRGSPRLTACASAASAGAPFTAFSSSRGSR